MKSKSEEMTDKANAFMLKLFGDYKAAGGQIESLAGPEFFWLLFEYLDKNSPDAKTLVEIEKSL